MAYMLIVDDNINIANVYKEVFEQEGFQVECADDEKHSLELVGACKPDVVLLDVDLKGDGGDRSGCVILNRLREKWTQEELPIIVISGVGDTSLLIEMIKNGANDFEVKPVEDFKSLVEKVKRYLHKKNGPPDQDLPVWEERIVGKSKVIMNLAKNILWAAQSECDTMILGETGTGKDLVARSFHALSKRQAKPFYEIDLTKISPNLFESEVFGYVTGAFSGAQRNKKGLIEETQGGVAFLNEIGELPLEQQAKLLTLLENKIITRVGSTEKIKMDIVILAATNRNLKKMVDKGFFRKDLYYRLYNHVLIIPPLRDHLEDIPLLVDHFIKELNPRYQKRIQATSVEVMEWMQKQKWEGNVRHLKKCTEVGIKNSLDNIISLQDIQSFVTQMEAETENSDEKIGQPPGTADYLELEYQDLKKQLKVEIDEKEKRYLLHHLEKNKKNKTKTARSIGINNYQQLTQAMKRLNIED
ncbi:sigma-54-dependent Fis family transcriptional regulator [bacterium]|nr:sigma-54-dependent Fis family transcriptional regulator [bacterium]